MCLNLLAFSSGSGSLWCNSVVLSCYHSPTYFTLAEKAWKQSLYDFFFVFCANTDFLQIWDSAENNHIYQEQPVSSTLAICRPCECPACQIGELFNTSIFRKLEILLKLHSRKRHWWRNRKGVPLISIL